MDPSSAYWLKQVIWLFILPPNGILSLAFAAALFATFGQEPRRKSAALAATCLALFALLMTPAVSQILMQWVERGVGEPLTQASATKLMAQDRPPEAIVILGGGQFSDAREKPHQSLLSGHTLMRVMHGARVARWTGLSILVSGGRPDGSPIAEAAIMARVLNEELGMQAQWVEDRSADTAENAQFSAAMLAEVGIEHVILVTEAFHMRRARAAFESVGLTVTAAPHAYLSGEGLPLPSTWLPRSASVERASLAIHEIIGRWWYQVRRWWQLIYPENA